MSTVEGRPGLLEGRQVLVMGLLSPQSFAWAIGERAVSEGAHVTYTVQDEQTIKRTSRFFRTQGVELEEVRLLACDVTKDEDIQILASRLQNPLDGLVYSIAFANPRTALTGVLYKTTRPDILKALEISAASFPLVVGGLIEAEKFNPNASIFAMTFDSQRTYPNYNWMGVAKAALEAEVRYLARDLGHLGIRVNSLSAGPQRTLAATHIPGFEDIGNFWAERAPLGWDLDEGRHLVAANAIYLLSDLSQGVSGIVHHVDGGADSVSLPTKNPEG